MSANMPKPAPATARFHVGIGTYPAMITSVCEPRGPSRKARSQLETGHDGGMPVRRFVAGKSPALTWWTNANFTRPSTVSIGKGAVASPVGGFCCRSRLLPIRPLCRSVGAAALTHWL
jgi:hypothetical protein